MTSPSSSQSAPAPSGDHSNAQSNQSRPGETLDAAEFSELEAAKVSETEGRGREALRPDGKPNDPQRQVGG